VVSPTDHQECQIFSCGSRKGTKRKTSPSIKNSPKEKSKGRQLTFAASALPTEVVISHPNKQAQQDGTSNPIAFLYPGATKQQTTVTTTTTTWARWSSTTSVLAIHHQPKMKTLWSSDEIITD